MNIEYILSLIIRPAPKLMLFWKRRSMSSLSGFCATLLAFSCSLSPAFNDVVPLYAGVTDADIDRIRTIPRITISRVPLCFINKGSLGTVSKNTYEALGLSVILTHLVFP